MKATENHEAVVNRPRSAIIMSVATLMGWIATVSAWVVITDVTGAR